MKTYLDYITFNALCLAMAETIDEWKPDIIVAVVRGGFTAAHIICKHLNHQCGVYFPHDDNLVLPQSYIPIRKIVFIEDLIAGGRTLKTLTDFMKKPGNLDFDWKIAPVLIDSGFDIKPYTDKIITYGLQTPHWMVMPYEEFDMVKENDRGLFRNGTDGYGK